VTTRREKIIQQFVAVIHDIPTVLDENIFRSRTKAISKSVTPAVIIEPERDTPDIRMVPKIDWTLTIKVTMVGRGGEPDQLIYPVLEKIHEKIMDDQTLGGYAMDVQSNGVEFDFLDGDGSIGIAVARYNVLYRTSQSDLTTT